MPTKTDVTLAMDEDALYETCRALADRGEDFGWNVYRDGDVIGPTARKRMVEWDDDSAAGWLTAWDAVTEAYRNATGVRWTY